MEGRQGEDEVHFWYILSGHEDEATGRWRLDNAAKLTLTPESLWDGFLFRVFEM